MKSLTLHNLPPELAERLDQYAREHNTSLNRAAQALLRKSLHMEPGHERTEDFRPFLGHWSKREQRQFEKTISDVEQVDPADWS